MMSENYTEVSLWAGINYLGWWYWGFIAFLGAANAWMLYKLAAPETLLGRVLRTLALIGFLLIALSPFNTAFGPLGMPFVLLAFLGVSYQLYQACKAAGKLGPLPSGAPATAKLANLIVERKPR